VDEGGQAADAEVRRHSGTLETVVDLAGEYGFTDVTGRPTSRFWDSFRKGRDLGKEASEGG
jgi:hypothetical protein